MYGVLTDSEDGNYNLSSFRENLEIMLSGAENEEFKKVGISLKLIEELNPGLKIIQVTFSKAKGPGFADSKKFSVKTK
jgi:hypothetical protein